MSEFDYGTGRRKNATARTRLYAGTGNIEVNGRKVEEYFPRKTLQMIIRQPLVLTKLVDKFDVKVNVCGGGVTGQSRDFPCPAECRSRSARRSEARRVPDPRRSQEGT